jgi:hypothetical protein
MMANPAALTTMKVTSQPGLVAAVEAALATAVLSAEIDASAPFYAIAGMSGRRYRLFINRLVQSLPNPAYLEVGSWAGSTLCSAISGNSLHAVAIDNWSEFGGPKAAFMQNVQRCVSPGANVCFLEGDFRAVDYSSLGVFNIYLYDGPHEQIDQFDGIALALPALSAEFVFIVDDWNWDRVRAGTFAAIRDTGLSVVYAAEIRTTLDGSHPENAFGHSDWHNGYYISVLRKPEIGPGEHPTDDEPLAAQ